MFILHKYNEGARDDQCIRGHSVLCNVLFLILLHETTLLGTFMYIYNRGYQRLFPAITA